MTKRAFVDTNILIYSVDPTEADKQPIAAKLMEAENLAMSVQVLQEFFAQAIKMRRPWTMQSEEAVTLITAWRRFPVQEMTLAIFDAALGLHRRYRLSYWDSAIVAAARALGCDTLYSEDMQHGQIIDGTRIVNPFL